jgi:hypothetical protein
MKRRVDYAKMNWFEKRLVLRMEKRAQDRQRRKEVKEAKGKGSLSWFRIVIFIIIIILIYYFWEEIIAFLKNIFS